MQGQVRPDAGTREFLFSEILANDVFRLLIILQELVDYLSLNFHPGLLIDQENHLHKIFYSLRAARPKPKKACESEAGTSPEKSC